MILLVPEINFFNFPFYFILSFIYQIKAFKIYYFLHRFKGKIELLDLSDYLDWEECILMKDNAVKRLEDILPKFQNSKWQVKIKKYNLDLSCKAKQDLQKEIEKVCFLKQIIQFYKNRGKVYIINSLKLNFLSKLDLGNDLFSYPQLKLFSMTNIILDKINFMINNSYVLFKVTCQFIYGILFHKRIDGDVKYIYDGVSPRELSIDKNKINFSWLVDNKLIHKKDILFLLPKADFQMKKYAKDYAKDNELLVTNNFGMLIYSSPKILILYLFKIIRILIKNIFMAKSVLENLMCTEFTIDILRWIPLVESLKPRVYISSLSNIGTEMAAVVYFNNIGIKTVIWSYGSSYYFYLLNKKICNFREVINCNFISSILVVWSQHCKEFFEEHPQNGLKIEVVGSLMSGEESIFKFDKSLLFKNMNIDFNNDFKYIAIFDSPVVTARYRGNYAFCPTPNSEELNYLFIRDVYRLLDDFENIILIYKPKRSLTSGKFSYSTESRQLFNEMNKNPKVMILDYNINPWAPIAIADICISMPFESPTVAAWHYEKPALFHDPTNIALYHRYQVLSDLISHNYAELKLKVHYWLFENNRIVNLPHISDFQGAHSKENSSDMFRKYLNSLTN